MTFFPSRFWFDSRVKMSPARRPRTGCGACRGGRGGCGAALAGRGRRGGCGAALAGRSGRGGCGNLAGRGGRGGDQAVADTMQRVSVDVQAKVAAIVEGEQLPSNLDCRAGRSCLDFSEIR